MGKKQNKSPKQRRLEDKEQSSCSVIAAQSFIEGNIKSQDDLLVSGRIIGDIECSGMVRLGQEGQIKGDIHSRFIIIEGELIGDIKEAEQLEIRKNGQIQGNITTKSLAMAEGSALQGNINMSKKGGKPIHFVEKRQKDNLKKQPD
jgi:cytoskeletal protein CcmA (bactofilin family)